MSSGLQMGDPALDKVSVASLWHRAVRSADVLAVVDPCVLR